MSIPDKFVAPSLPVNTLDYQQSLQERFRNVLRLYFTLIDNHNSVIDDQVSTNQTSIWLNM